MSLRVCVYCGARRGHRPVFAEAAAAFGRTLAERGMELVYGGGGVGLMGVLADAVLAAGGRVTGVIPRSLVERELAHAGLDELLEVDGMHARKARMAALADVFVALPGGLGTLDELFEIWTWAQLGFHRSPVGLLDVEDYYQGLLHFLERSEQEGFVGPSERRRLLVGREPGALLEALARQCGPRPAPGAAAQPDGD